MSLLAPGRNIVLVGLMGAGKTTVGRLVAAQLGRRFLDTDDEIEADAGRAISEIFAAEGERGFRRHEAAAVRRVSALRGQVIAVGGGAVLDPSNVTALRATGDLVLLDAEPAELAARVRDPGSRPLLAEAEDLTARLAELRAVRDPAYASVSHVIDTSRLSPDEVAAEVVAWARTRPGLLDREELRP